MKNKVLNLNWKNSIIIWNLLSVFVAVQLYAAADPLPSWNDGKIKSALLQFIKETTHKDNNFYIPPEERIAAFDQDGTLWVEQPMYTQLAFAFDRIKKMAPEHPEWANTEPYKSILNNELSALSKFSEPEIEKVVLATHAGMSVEDFHKAVHEWLATAVHPRFKKPYTELVYQPMLEVIQLFKDNGYACYIVSGGGQEFMRAYADKVYGIPPERVIGTIGKVQYEYRDGKPVLLKLPDVLLIDDKQGKPAGINMVIGRRPSAAFGNSIGDRQMLEWTQGGKGKRFELLVHHDDPVREYAYGGDSQIGTFSESLMEEARKNGWYVVSMKNDWKIIFPWQKEGAE